MFNKTEGNVHFVTLILINLNSTVYFLCVILFTFICLTCDLYTIYIKSNSFSITYMFSPMLNLTSYINIYLVQLVHFLKIIFLKFYCNKSKIHKS